MKRQIIKTRPQRPYILARVVVALAIIAVVLFAAYEVALRAGLHFH